MVRCLGLAVRRRAPTQGEEHMPTIDRDGVSVSYNVEGEGVPILLTHGYSSSMRMWQPQAEALGSRYQLITWDMRGHGETASPAAPEQYSEAATVADMAAILDAVGANDAVIGGLSLGGY